MPKVIYSRRRIILERFETNFIKLDKDECWEWKASRYPSGYGQCGSYLNSGRYAHRLSYILYKSRIPEGLKVLHECDNPCCVNPSHLFLGTQRQNLEDMTSKGRRAYGSKVRAKNPLMGDRHPMRADPDLPRKGEEVNFAKLTERAVKEIRNSDLDNHQLACRYGVTPQTIYFVRTRRTWKHVK